MINEIVLYLITRLCDAIVGSRVIERVMAAIQRWAEKTFKEGTPADDANSSRRNGVLQEIETWGKDPNDPCPDLSESWRRLLLELALRLVKSRGTE